MTQETAPDRKTQWIQTLQENGYRITAPRQVVIEIMAESDYLLIPAEIYDRGREQYDKLGLVTVYRTLEKLEELNLVMRVHRPDNCHAFIANVEGHQHLLICERCGQVHYFGGDNIDTLIRRVEEESGFEIKEHWLQFFGICEDCR